MSFSIERLASSALPVATLRELRQLCTIAYAEDFTTYLDDIGPGVHLLGRARGELVSHAMWVTRTLETTGQPPLLTAYVEAVATLPTHQRRGLATKLLERIALEILDHDLGALSPTGERFYARLGWEPWRGPLFIRTNAGLQPTPDESVMILRLPRTPPDVDTNAALSVGWRPGEVW